jgi:hypothetical protein
MHMRRSRTLDVVQVLVPGPGVLAGALALALACSNSAETPGPGAPGTGGTTGSGGIAATGGAGAGSGGSAAGTGGAGTGGASTGGTGAGGAGTGGASIDMASEPDASPETGADTSAAGPRFPAGKVAKIMVLGSSNETRTCWRAFLWQKLRAAGVMNFDYVGRTNIGPDCGVAGYDKDVEAAPGTIITGFSANDFATRYKANPPDIVLVHVGGADAREGIAPTKILAAYTLAVEQARLVNPRVVFFVGLHTPQQPMTGINELNAAIPPWAMQTSTPDSPVYSVDLFKGIVSATDLSDGTHLNEAGSQKVADWFLAPMLPLFKP